MNGQKRKLFKLGLPIILKHHNSSMTVDDGYFKYSIPIKELDKIKFKSLDQDGFIAFEIHYSEPEEIAMSPQVKSRINGYTLFHSNVAKSLGYGFEKSIYEYYKRDSDLSYLIVIKRGVEVLRRITLGSLRNPNKDIGLVAKIINDSFSLNTAFDRKKLIEILPSNLSHRQKLKGVLDILAKEELIEKVRTEKRKEIFVKTRELEKFMISPRLLLKPNGSTLVS